MNPPWRREKVDFEEEKRLVAEERRTARGLLHQAADLVIQIQSAAEEMERILTEMAEGAEGDERGGPGGDVAGGGTAES